MTTAIATRITTASVTAPLFETDAYKLGHRNMSMAAGKTTRILANFTNRGSRIPGIDKVVHFGLQAFLQSYCVDAFAPFFDADEDAAVAEYQETLDSILGPNTIGTDHIRALHRKGHLPLSFSTLPEGTRVPVRIPTILIENTDPDFFWLVNYVETVLSASIWQPATSATQADACRGVLDAAAETTGSAPASVNWQLHDFSFRGMAGTEAAAASGAAHLLSFMGSDSLASIDWVRRYYPSAAGTPNGQVLGSIPATEHAIMCAGGKDNEQETYSRLMDIHPSGLLGIVSDTWDLWNVLQNILPNLKDKVMGRDGKIVIRPDSGDPADIICGTSTRPGAVFTAQVRTLADDPEFYGAMEILWDTFGGTINDAGYRVLDPHVGLIYGDSITLERATDITRRLKKMGFASENIVFGVGSFTYQYVTRDTFASAIKDTWAVIDGAPRNMLKDPVTDNGTKKSATGRLAVTRNADGELELIERATPEQEEASLLQPVWANGEFITRQSFADVRAVLGNIA